MTKEEIAILKEAEDLLREYNVKKAVDKSLLVRLMSVWNKLNQIECQPAPFSSEQIGECEVKTIMGQIAIILLSKAKRIVF